jgi:NADPH-dependent 2,4-dienoyl-CoA reductase/sulfur reductase-like enzyme
VIRFDGQPIASRPGQTVAAALTAAGVRVWRTTRHGAPRGLFCGMGVCQDCLVTIDGRSNQRACMAKISGPHEVRSQDPLPTLMAGREGEAAASGPEQVEILVLGGGAGGLTAAAVAAEAGAEVVLVDERPNPGGQFYKQPAGDPPWNDAQFAGGRRLIARARAAGVRFVAGTAWSTSLPLRVEVFGEQGARSFRPRKLVVATGAFERPLPVPGWTLPGVMTTGAAQTLVRSYGVLPGRRVLVAGNGPLNLQVAGELRRAGAEVVAVAEAAPRPGMRSFGQLAAMAAAAPGATVRGAGYLARTRTVMRWGTCLAKVTVAGNGLHARLDDGSAWDVDTVAMGYGFLPANELLRLLGCRHRYDPARGHLVAERDAHCRTTVPDVLAVGDCCGLGGAAAAEAEAAIAGAAAVGRKPDPQAQRALARHRRFQAALWAMFAAPPADWAATDAATAVCRCEEVELGAVQAALSAGATSLAAIKRATRAGMGRCQGRYCGPLLAELLHQRTGRSLDELAFFAPRPPVRPVPLGAIATAEETT